MFSLFSFPTIFSILTITMYIGVIQGLIHGFQGGFRKFYRASKASQGAPGYKIPELQVALGSWETLVCHRGLHRDFLFLYFLKAVKRKAEK